MHEIFFAVHVGHPSFPSFVTGTDLWKKSNFHRFSKTSNLSKIQVFRQNECTRLFRRRRSSPSSVIRHFPLSSQGRTCEKNQILAVFQKQAIFPKFKIFRQNECTRFFRRRRSSPSSVVRHFPLSSQGRTCEKNQILAVFQKQAIFPKFKIFRQNECTRFFRRRRSSPSSVVRHFPLSSQGRTCEKNQIFAVFQKQAIFPKFKIFGQNECTRFFRRRRSSQSLVVRHFPLSSQGRTCEKNQIFAVQKQAIFPKFKIFRQNECTRFFLVGRRRGRSSVISLFRHRDGPVKKIKFSPFFKNKRSFQNSRFLGKMSARDFFCCCRSSVVRHFPLSSQGRTCEKNQIFAVFQKQAIFPKFKIFRQNECTRFFWRRRSSPSSVVRHFPLSSQGRTCEKNQIFAVFQKQAIFPKFKIFRQNECTRFFRRCRRSSVVISLFRHRDGPVKKIKFSPFFKNKQSFQNSRFLGKMSARDFFCCCRSSVIRHFPLSSQGRTCEKNQIFAVFQKQAIFPKFKIFRQNECTRFFWRRRSSPSSVVRHFPLSSQGRTCEKNQILAVFQKQAIFPKFKIFRQNECTRLFFAVVGRRSSVISLFRHRDGPVKKIKFSPFFKNKQSFQNSRFLGKMSVRDFFCVVGRRRRRSSVISLFRHRDGPVKKIKFSPFFKNKQSFQNSRFLGKMSAQDFFGVVGRRRRRSSVISLFRHRDGPVKKIKFSPFFKNKQSFQNSRFLGKMSARDFFCCCRSSVIRHFLFRHRDGPVKKIKFSPFFKNKRSFQNSRFLGKMSARDFFCCCRSSVIRHFPLSSQGRTCEKNQIFAVFQKQAIFPKFKIFRQNECTRFFRRRRSSPSSVVRHFPLSSQGRTCEKNEISKTSNLSKIQDF